MCLLGLFLVLLALVFLADDLAMSGAGFSLTIGLMTLSLAGLVVTFPVAYYAARYLENRPRNFR